MGGGGGEEGETVRGVQRVEMGMSLIEKIERVERWGLCCWEHNGGVGNVVSWELKRRERS